MVGLEISGAMVRIGAETNETQIAAVIRALRHPIYRTLRDRRVMLCSSIRRNIIKTCSALSLCSPFIPSYSDPA